MGSFLFFCIIINLDTKSTNKLPEVSLTLSHPSTTRPYILIGRRTKRRPYKAFKGEENVLISFHNGPTGACHDGPDDDPVDFIFRTLQNGIGQFLGVLIFRQEV